MAIDDQLMLLEHGLTCGNRASSNNNNNDHARLGLVFFIFFLLHPLARAASSTWLTSPLLPVLGPGSRVFWTRAAHLRRAPSGSNPNITRRGRLVFDESFRGLDIS
jgi:hypothetical protein